MRADDSVTTTATTPLLPENQASEPGAPAPEFESLSTNELGRRLISAKADLDAATARWLMDLAEFDRREGYRADGQKSTANWLNMKCGLSMSAAYERVRVARKLTKLDVIRSSFLKGQVSYSKVRAITRIANVDNENDLLAAALAASASTVEAICLRYKTRKAADEDPSFSAWENRRYASRNNHDGTVTFMHTVPYDEALAITNQVEAELEAKLRRISSPHHSRRAVISDFGGIAALRADAAADLLTGRSSGNGPATAVVGIVDTRTRLVPDPTNRATAPEPSGSTSESATCEPARTETVNTEPVNADGPPSDTDSQGIGPSPTEADDLATEPGDVEPGDVEPSAADPGATDPTEGDPGATDPTPLSPGSRTHLGPTLTVGGNAVGEGVIRRMLCDCDLESAILDDTGQPYKLGLTARIPTKALRNAVLLRDGHTCQFPGCDAEARLDLHHVLHWIDNGPTDHDNLLALCRFHHGVVHEGKWTVTLEGPANRPVFTRPDGTVLTVPVTSGDANRIPKAAASTEAGERQAADAAPMEPEFPIDIDWVTAEIIRREIHNAEQRWIAENPLVHEFNQKMALTRERTLARLKARNRAEHETFCGPAPGDDPGEEDRRNNAANN